MIDMEMFTVKGLIENREVITFVDAVNQDHAIAQAENEGFDVVTLARQSFYGEWDCGSTCGYDDEGNHWRIEDNGEMSWNQPPKQKFS